jgi:hypothetical protein
VAESTVVERLGEIPGVGPGIAQIVLAEIGLDMSRFPTAGHLVSWAKLSPRTIQSGPRSRGGKTGKGNPYLKGVLGEVAAAAAKTNTFLGERNRRLVTRRGKLKALVIIARSILVIIWHLLTDPTIRFHDLGADYHTSRPDKNRKTRNHIQDLKPWASPSPSPQQPDPPTQARPDQQSTINNQRPRPHIPVHLTPSDFPITDEIDLAGVGVLRGGLRAGGVRHRTAPTSAGDRSRPFGPQLRAQLTAAPNHLGSWASRSC